MNGELVNTTLESSNDREIAAGMAFLIKEPPAELMKQAQHGLLSNTDPNTISWGSLEGEGSLAQLSKLTLAPGSKAGDAPAVAEPKPEVVHHKPEAEKDEKSHHWFHNLFHHGDQELTRFRGSGGRSQQRGAL